LSLRAAAICLRKHGLGCPEEVNPKHQHQQQQQEVVADHLHWFAKLPLPLLLILPLPVLPVRNQLLQEKLRRQQLQL